MGEGKGNVEHGEMAQGKRHVERGEYSAQGSVGEKVCGVGGAWRRGALCGEGAQGKGKPDDCRKRDMQSKGHEEGEYKEENREGVYCVGGA